LVSWINRLSARLGLGEPVKRHLLAIAFAIIGSAGIAHAQAFMNATEVRRLFSGLTVSHVNPTSGQDVRMSFRPGGAIHGTAGSRTDVGRWWVRDGGALCLQFSYLERGQTLCNLLVRNGNSLIRHDSGGKRRSGQDWIIVGGG
jgi:hypothetical protein